MSDLQTSIQRMLDQLDPPGIKAIREVQKKVESYQSPGLKAILETKKKMDAMINRPEFVRHAQLVKYHHSFLGKEIQYYRHHASFTTSFTRVMGLLENLDLLPDEFELSEDDEIELVDYDLLPEADLVVPESKIVLLNQFSQIQKTIDDIYKNNEQLYHIHHREFEEMMAELLRSRDFEVYLTKKTRDGGTDIIALQNLAGLPIKMLIECKKYAPNRKIGVDIIRGFSHVVNTKQANKGIIFTTSYFTADARKEQQLYMPYLLDLRDYHDVINWINSYVE